MEDCRLNTDGLTTDEVKILQIKHGKNELTSQKNESFFLKVLHILCEPMFLLLFMASIIYFILGEPGDGIIMLIFVIGIICIDVIQEWKTDKTLNALKNLSAPHITVIRDSKEVQVAGTDLVPGDIMMIHEGEKIPADGIIVRCNDLCLNESSLTGEAEGVWKVTHENVEKTEEYWRKDYCYAGTLVTQGSGVVSVEKIGEDTEYGRIGVNTAKAPVAITPLQKQTKALVKLCAVIAAILFVLVCIVTWFNISDSMLKDRFIKSILSGITISMAMIPEEFPVILTVFLSMGAWRLAKKKSLVRRLPSVEALGAVSVLCVDKTGTVTMNQMTVKEIWAARGDKKHLCEIMGFGCEIDAYDPMEKAMLLHCEKIGITKDELFCGELIKEYAFSNEYKRMGHVWKRKDKIIIAAKGSAENILSICNLSKSEIETVQNKINKYSMEGLRVIAVAKKELTDELQIPENLKDCSLEFCGLIGLYDPPRESVKNDIAVCNKAGIRVVMITGDNGITAASIAEKIGMDRIERKSLSTIDFESAKADIGDNYKNIITGDMLEKMTEEELRQRVKTVNIFSRVIPEHKMRIVKALKDNGDIVAMTGDGVNDAPALKYADIGIAMGKRGSEVSREAADLILMDDNFSTIVDTIKDGRRIYDNIRKAVGYVFTIHIPIAFTSLLAPMLFINPSSLMLLPLHVVLLELIIDPTCSIVLERQPAEHNIMERNPRNPHERLLSIKTIFKSVIQGLIIFGVSFGTYYYMLRQNADNPAAARTMGLSIIMIANLFLVQVNSSDIDFVGKSIKSLVKDKVMWMVSIMTLTGILIMLYTPVNDFLKLAPLSAGQFATVIIFAAVSVMWYEIVKFIKRVT